MDTYSTEERSSTPNNEIPVEISATPITPSPDRSPRPAAWIALLRRTLFLVLGFGLAMLLIQVGFRFLLPNLLELRSGREIDWSRSLTFRAPVSELVAQRLPNTLNLLLAAFILALALALIAVLVGALAHLLENKAGWLGSLLKGLGRLFLFPLGASPALILGLLLLIVFAFQNRILPAGGMISAGGSPDDFADRIRHLILPALALALMPALLAAQSTTRRVTLPGQKGSIRLWLGGFCHLLSALLGQIGGWLSAAILVEIIFAWPGTGRLFLQALFTMDLPILLSILNTWAVVILIIRLVSEIFRWITRLLLREPSHAVQPPTPQRKAARLVWVIIALALLLVPLGLAVAGLTIDAEQANRLNLVEPSQPPSTEHLLGTDQMGRDLLARLLSGTSRMVGYAFAAALLVFILAGIGGALSGFLSSRRTWIMESLSDLILLPADILLFIPTIALAGIWLSSSPARDERGAVLLILVVALTLVPRAIRSFQALWLAAPRLSYVFTAGLLALFLTAFYGATLLFLGLDFFGLGTPPPTATLGGILAENMQTMRMQSTSQLIICLVVGLFTLSLYTAADALVGFFRTKDALLHMNE